MGALSSLPVGHVIKVLCELRQVGALLFILLFRPKQNFWYLPRKKNRGVGEYHTLSWDLCLKIPSHSLCSWSFADTSSAVSCGVLGIAGIAEGMCADPSSLCPPPALVSVPRFYRRVQHLRVSAARLFHDCGNHARCPACGKER